jgi:lipopolysaccharide biosynthesis glycosyltransferase
MTNLMFEMNDNFQHLSVLNPQLLENETIDRLFLHGFSTLGSEISKIFNLHWNNNVICYRIPYNYIDTSDKRDRGDIDIAFIPASAKIEYTGTQNIFHDFSLDYSNICSVEVKVMTWHEDVMSDQPAKLKTEKTSKKKIEKARQQAERNLQMGFAQSLLLYLIIADAPPWLDGSRGIHDWGYSSDLADHAVKKVITPNDEGRYISTSTNDEFGTALLGFGGIHGKHEHLAGSYSLPTVLQSPVKKHHSMSTVFLKKLEDKLNGQIKLCKGKFATNFASTPQFPAVRACSDGQCKKIYIAPNRHDYCPVCGKHPR